MADLGNEYISTSTTNESEKYEKSADDILDELFTQLGSKKPTDSLADFLAPPKKKKAHKEKVKKHKEKGESKSKKKEKEDKKKTESKNRKRGKEEKKKTESKKKKKSENKLKSGEGCSEIQEEFPWMEDDSQRSKMARRRSVSPERTHEKARQKIKPDKDVEEGEIIEKHSTHHHHERRKEKNRMRSNSENWASPSRDSDSEYIADTKERFHSRSSRKRSHDENRSSEREFRGRSRSPREDPKYYDDGYDIPRSPRRDRSPGSRYGTDSRHNSRKYSDRRSPHRRMDDRRAEFRPYRRLAPGTEPGSFRGRRYAPPYRRSRSRSRSRSRHPTDLIDKAKLLEIARRNATLLMKKGVLPTDIFSKDQIVAIKAGGKSVEELTAYCRRLARKDAHGEITDDDGNESDGVDQNHFIHHPFIVKERPMPQITLNIRNAIPLPVRTPQELAIENAVRKSQFPVSSGCQHRFKELEWQEVDKDGEKSKNKAETAVALVAPTNSLTASEKPVASVEPSPAAKPTDNLVSLEPQVPAQVDIGSVISARLKAMRALKDNPDSEDAKKQLDTALQEMEQWAQAKALEPKFLTVSDLQSGPQAWAKRDQLKNAKEVASGMGMHLLQKMGWKPGEGLGKNKEGTTEPLALDVKTDKKGLMSQADLKVKGPQANVGMLYDLSGKHPVSALMELCTKRRWGPPVFDLCLEHGPPHQKSFVFKVTVNGVEYQPCIATNNKKLAKANAAAFCLQSLGLLKPTPPPAAAETLQTVPVAPDVSNTLTTEVAGMRMVPSHLLQTVTSNPLEVLKLRD